MSTHTFLAAVRFKNGEKLKFQVQDVPDDLATVRQIILNELKDKEVQSVVIRTDGISNQIKQQAA